MRAMLAVAVLVAFAATASAQTAEPAVTDGTIARHSVGGALEPEFTAFVRDATTPMWIGYTVRGRDRSRGDGCWDWRNGGRVVPTPVKLEGSADLFVLRAK